MKSKKAILLALSALAISCTKPDPSISLDLDCGEHSVVIPSTTITINYVISSQVPTTLEVTASDDIKKVRVKPSDADPHKGVITVEFTRMVTEGKTRIDIQAFNYGSSLERSVSFEAEGLNKLGETEMEVGANECTAELKFKTNTDFELIIPDDAKSWISVQQTKALVEHSVVVRIDENKEFERTARLRLVSVSEKLSQDYTITQKGNSHKIVFVTTSKSPLVPDLGGENVKGRVYWIDNDSYVEWKAGISYNYTDSKSSHTVTIQSMGADSFSFDSLKGVTTFNLTEFLE